MRKVSLLGTFLFIILWSSIPASAAVDFKLPIQQRTQVPFGNYQVYYGDFDRDYYQDLYFHGIARDGVADQEKGSPPGFAYFGVPEGGYQSASPWDMTEEALLACRSCAKALAGVDYVLGDLDGDGAPELLVKGRDANQSSLLISGLDDGDFPRILLEILPTGHVRVPGQAASRESYFRNNLRDADTRITDGRLIVDGTSHGLNQMRLAAAQNGMTTAKTLSSQRLSALSETSSVSALNIAAPPSPSLPSHSLSAAQIADLDALASVGGEFRVNEMGAATYTIPLELPVGTAGVTPQVALTYSSQAGVGNMGLGWSLQAGGAITRCRQTLQQDGVALPIQFSDQDRYCLDGQRLVLIAGTYGNDRAEYKTEIDSGVIVTSHGGSRGHPDYFEVRAKDGSVSRYGGSGADHNSKQRGRNAAGALLTNRIFSWNLSEFRDKDGTENKVVYTYQSAANYFRLSSISYGYGSGSTPDVTVSFQYGPRKKSEIEWIMDSRFEDNSRLNSVQIRDKNVLVREYGMSYNASSAGALNDLMDRVTSISNCSSNVCAQPLQLSWGFPSPGAASKGNGKVTTYSSNLFSFGTTGYSANGHPAERITTGDRTIPAWSVNNLRLLNLWPGEVIHSYQEADVNGDGRSDLIITTAKTHEGYFSLYTNYQQASGILGYATAQLIGHLGSQEPQLFPVDFNADGRMDLAVYQPDSNAWSTYLSKPQANLNWKLEKVENFLPANLPHPLKFADANSDGRPDLIYIRSNKLYIHFLKRSSGYDSAHDVVTDLPNRSSYEGWGYDIRLISDINEDGRVDVWISTLTSSSSPFIFNSRQCQINIEFTRLMSAGSSSFVQASFPFSGTFNKQVSSVSACSDLVQNGRGHHEKLIGPVILDIDGDGLTDMVWAVKGFDDHHTRSIFYRRGAPNNQFEEQRSFALSFDAYNFEPWDTDSDGDYDLLITGKDDAQYIARWNGTSFDAPASHMSAQSGRQTRYTDIDGDGNVDRVTLKDNNLSVARGRPRTNNVVVQFKTSFDVVTSVAYEPLRDSGRYRYMKGISVTQRPVNEGGPSEVCWGSPTGGGCSTLPTSVPVVDASEFYSQINNPFKGVPADTDLKLHSRLPAQEWISAMPIVTRVASSAPVPDNVNQLVGVEYHYEGLKIQAGGRGMLGFKKLTTTDMQTGVRTTTEYRQDWPFMGTPVRTTDQTHHGQLLSESFSEMAIHGITSANIEAKRVQGSTGTANLGSLVLYSRKVRDISYDVPQDLVAMPGSGPSDPTLTQKILSEVITTTQVDAYGNVVDLTMTTKPDPATTVDTTLIYQRTISTYYPGEGERLGRLQRSEVRSQRYGMNVKQRTSEFTYYGYPGAPADCNGSHLKGLLCSEKVVVADLTRSEAPLPTLHFYDSRGNKTHTRIGYRVSPYAQYDAKGRFVQATYDVFNSTSLTADATPAGYKTPAGAVVLKTSEVTQRDIFGTPLRTRSRIGQNAWLEQTQATTPLGAVFFKGDATGVFEQTRAQRTSADANCPANTVFTKTITQAGGAQSAECYDKLGRVIGGYKPTLQGGYVRTQQEYDVLGRVVRAFEPAFGAPTLSTDTVYDILGRPVLVTHPYFVTDASGVESSTLATTSYTYSFVNTEIRHSGHVGGEDRVVLEHRGIREAGSLSSVKEMGRQAVSFTYDPHANLTAATAPGYQVLNEYNDLGQKIVTRDPDKGTWLYNYNGYGELVSQTDANGDVTNFGYDIKGRKSMQLFIPANGSASVHYWNYDVAANGLGQIGLETRFVVGAGTEFTRRSTFDSFGRVNTSETEFAGANGAVEIHHQKLTYDQFGRVFQAFDAARTGADFTRNAIENVYNERGYLTNVKDASSGDSFYQITSTDVRGNANVILYGSGEATVHVYHPRTGFLTKIYRSGVLGAMQYYDASWDHLGNMTSRKDSLMGNTIETFRYDEYNRLVRNTLSGASVSVSYDSADNITSKSDVEGGATYQYHSTKKHAVAKVGNREFVYDKNGNVTEEKRNGAVLKRFEYTPNDLVSKITHNGHTSEFFYGSDDQRYKRIDTDSQGRRTTTLYIGGVEKIHYHDGVVEWKRQIGGIVQVTHRVTNGTPNAGTRHYFHKDHLGSITAITDGSGNVLRRMAFDPWGARRTIMPSNEWLATTISHSSILASYAKTTKPYTSRGYTGHEMLDEVGIIHMNGRIYDAYLARFLQADPFIQAPTLAASYNRYSYVMNNPMNAVDPSGYFSLSKAIKKGFKRAFKYTGAEAIFKTIADSQALMMVASIAVNFIPGCQGWCTVAIQAAFQAGTTYAMTGSFSAAFKSGAIGFASGAAFMGIGSAAFGQSFGSGAHLARSFAHGMVGGISSVLQGGKFGHGFASAGLTKFINVNAAFKNSGMGSVRFDGARIVAAAVVGGTISDVTGGKFANGAMTAAMGQALNGNLQNAREQAVFESIGEGARVLDERVGFWRGVGKGFKSFGAGLVKAVGYGGSYWGSKVCSAWSSECASTHQFIRDEGGRIGSALYELTTDQAMATVMASSASNTAEGYVTGRALAALSLGKSPGPAYLKIGIGVVAVTGNLLQMSEMYGDALTGKHLVDAVFMGAQNDM